MNPTKPPACPWFDKRTALDELSARASAGAEAGLERVGRELIDRGFALLPGLIPPELCDAIVADFEAYVTGHAEYAAQHVDGSGQHLRFVNLHLTSDAAMQVGNNESLMRTLDFIFGRRAAIYTSLFFEHGSQQPIHRDSPFFHTYPMDYFVGVWVALEDVHPDAGPLMYMPSGHRFPVDQRAIYEEVRREHPDRDAQWLLHQALERYYGVIITRAKEMGEPVRVLLRKGDCAIWHPALPHGGAPAADPHRTRKSIVYHCTPEDMQVHQHYAFFTSEAEPPVRYGFRTYRDRKYAIAGEPAFQVQERAT